MTDSEISTLAWAIDAATQSRVAYPEALTLIKKLLAAGYTIGAPAA
jgi:hypothetical protein